MRYDGRTRPYWLMYLHVYYNIYIIHILHLRLFTIVRNENDIKMYVQFRFINV